MELAFKPADILLPKNCDMTKWSVIACDQYTSEPEYWREVERFVGDAPSALRLILPEVWLEEGDGESRIGAINQTMRDYLAGDIFSEHQNTYIYVERHLRNGGVRKGVVGKLDLEQYDFNKGSRSQVRATEETVLSRIPPRVKIRQDAPLELPHIMILIDDPGRTVIEPIAREKPGLQKAYGFELMRQSGGIEGFFLSEKSAACMEGALSALAGQIADDGFLFAMGDGNHSLASAKQRYENLKQTMPKEKWERHPSRYALVEVVNLHDDTLQFEAIHRVLFDVDPGHVLAELGKMFRLEDSPGCQTFTAVYGQTEKTVSIANPADRLTVASLQRFIDDCIGRFGGRVDYIHDEAAVRALAAENNTIGFLLPAIAKSELFPAVAIDGALPRKTFSMGHACDKRFYLEARKIK